MYHLGLFGFLKPGGSSAFLILLPYFRMQKRGFTPNKCNSLYAKLRISSSFKTEVIISPLPSGNFADIIFFFKKSGWFLFFSSVLLVISRHIIMKKRRYLIVVFAFVCKDGTFKSIVWTLCNEIVNNPFFDQGPFVLGFLEEEETDHAFCSQSSWKLHLASTGTESDKVWYVIKTSSECPESKPSRIQARECLRQEKNQTVFFVRSYN